MLIRIFTLWLCALPAMAAVALPSVNAEATAALAEYWRAPAHKAFVISPSGAWAWLSDEATAEAALAQAHAACQAHSPLACVTYAENERVVLDAQRWPTLWRPYANAAQAQRAPSGVRRGERFPDLLLISPTGKKMALSQARGEIVVLHFWGTWCPSCRAELPQFQRLRRALGNKVRFVFTQVREPASSARQWLKRQGMDLPLHDSGALDSRDAGLNLAGGARISDRDIAPVFPSTYVLDRHGVVVFSLRGSAPDWMGYAPFLKDLAAQTRHGTP